MGYHENFTALIVKTEHGQYVNNITGDETFYTFPEEQASVFVREVERNRKKVRYKCRHAIFS